MILNRRTVVAVLIPIALSPWACGDPATKLATLKPGQAAVLGEAEVVGEFNEVARRWRLQETGPRGRDFTIKMAWAPDRQTALFCGANHGVPHRINDVWEFDLTKMRWTMLYAPDNPRSYTGLGKDHSDVVFKDGLLQTKRGGPAVIAHSWWGLTYDPEACELLLMNTWVTKKKEAVTLIGGDPEDLYTGPPLWAFSPERKAWRPIKSDEPRPRPIFGGLLEYIPSLGGTMWHANNWQMRASWLYEHRPNRWRNLDANSGDQKAFEASAAMPEQVGYYDPERDALIIQRHRDTHHFDVKENRWKKVLSRNKEASDVPFGHDAYSPMYRDSASGDGLLVEFKTDTLWAYDPDALTWTKLAPQGDPIPPGKKRLAYADPKHGVFVIIKDTTVWAYRHAAQK